MIESIKQHLEKEAKDKVKYTKGIASLKLKRDRLRKMLKERNYEGFLKKYKLQTEINTETIK